MRGDGTEPRVAAVGPPPPEHSEEGGDWYKERPVAAQETGEAGKNRGFADSAFVEADRVILRQAFVNVLHNAVKYSPEGGQISIGIGVDGDRVLVTFKDSGPGIPAEDREHIFDPFFTTKSGGMGLGLAISSTLVANCGGKLRLAKSDPAGSIFQIAIPVGGPHDG